MAKSIMIAFPNGGILPDAIAGKNSAKIEPHKPVSVPEAYGLQLINDRFAVLAQTPAKLVTKEPAISQAQSQSKLFAPATTPNKPDLVTLGKAVGVAKRALADASDDNRPTLQAEYDAAKQALEDAKAVR